MGVEQQMKKKIFKYIYLNIHIYIIYIYTSRQSDGDTDKLINVDATLDTLSVYASIYVPGYCLPVPGPEDSL